MKTRVAWLLCIAAGIGVGLALASKRDARSQQSGKTALTDPSKYIDLKYYDEARRG